MLAYHFTHHLLLSVGSVYRLRDLHAQGPHPCNHLVRRFKASEDLAQLVTMYGGICAKPRGDDQAVPFIYRMIRFLVVA